MLLQKPEITFQEGGVMINHNSKSLFKVEIEIEGMGVLENGIPYLTSGALAKLCGVNPRTIQRINENWEEERFNKRGREIQNILDDQQYSDSTITIPVVLNGRQNNVFPGAVCMAILEYYAFCAQERKIIAQRNFRLLARLTFQLYIYKQVNYNPQQERIKSWKHFHDRVSLISGKVPHGYFCIFKEIAGMIVDMINAGIFISDKIVPDISVGKAWSKVWRDNDFDNTHGKRITFEHNYPDYYHQAVSNPQYPWAYPNKALGEFRTWFEATYLSTKYPVYIRKKLHNMPLPEYKKKQITTLFTRKPISNGGFRDVV